MRVIRILATMVTGLLFLAVLGVVGLAALLESGFFTPRMLAAANERLAGSDLRLAWGALYWRPWSGINVEDVRLTSPGLEGPSGELLAAIDEVEIGYRFMDLLSGRPQLRRVRLYNAAIDLPVIARWRELQADRFAFEAGPDLPRGRAWGGLIVEDVWISGARIGGETGPLLTDLALRGNLHGAEGIWSLTIDDAAARVTAGHVDEEVELTGAVSWANGLIGVDGLHFTVGGGRVSFQGHIDPALRQGRILTTGYAIPLERIASWVEFEHPILTGALEFRFLARGGPDSLDVTGGLTGVAEDGTGRDIVFSVRRRDEQIAIESLRVHTGDSQLDVTATLRLEDAPRVDGVATFHRIDPALLLAEADLSPVTDLDGVVRFEGVGLSREEFRGSVEAEIESGAVFGWVFDGASLELAASRGNVTLRGARVTRGGSVITGAGTIDAVNHLVAEFSGTVADLGDVFAADGADSADSANTSRPATGQASAEVRLFGPLASPKLEAGFHFDDPSFHGVRARSLDLGVRSDALGMGAELAIELTGRDVGYGGRLVPRATASGVWRDGDVVIRSVRLESDARGELRLAGDLAFGGDGAVAGLVEEVDVRSPDGTVRWTNAGPLRIEKREGTLRFTSLDLRGGTGQIRGDVAVDSTGQAFARISGENVDLSVFGPFLLLPRELGGMLNFDAGVLVGPDTLAATVKVGLADGRFGEDRIERVEGTVEIRDDRVLLENLVLRSSFATADIGGTVRLAEGKFRTALADSASRAALLGKLVLEGVKVEVDSPELDRVHDVFPGVPSPGGSGQLTAVLEGPAAEPRAEFSVSLANARLEGEPVDLDAQGSFDGRVLTLTGASLRSGGGVLEASGFLPVAWGAKTPKPKFERERDCDLRLDAERFPIRCVAIFVPFCEQLSGPATADLRVVGREGRIGLEGTVLLEEATLALPEVDPFVAGNAEGTFGPSGLELSLVRFEDGRGGIAHGTAKLGLENLSLVELSVDLDASRWHYRSPLGASGMGDGHLQISLRELADGRHVPYLEGRFDVTRADLEEKLLMPASEASGLGDVPAGVNVPGDAVTAPGREEKVEQRVIVLAEIDLRAKNNVWLATRQAKIEMTGDVTFHATEQYAGITGDVKTLRGSYAVLNTEFQVEKGEIEFVDARDPLNSYIDAVATAPVLDEMVTVEVTGTLRDPLIELRTDSGMSEEEIYELLALRIRRGEETGTLDDQRDLVASWGALWATRFGREISGELGIDTFEVEPEGGTTTVGVGKRLGSAVFVKYSQQVTGAEPLDPTATVERRNETPERQILLQYRLSEIFQLHGATGTIEGSEYVNVDLRAEWGY